MTHSASVTNNQTIGTAEADIHNIEILPPTYKFKDDGTNTRMWRRDGRIYISVRQSLSHIGMTGHFLTFRFRDLNPGETNVTFDFSNPSEIFSTYTVNNHQSSKPHTFASGTMTVSLASSGDHLTATFSGKAYSGLGNEVTITAGDLDLKGFEAVPSSRMTPSGSVIGEGYIAGFIDGGPDSVSDFIATDVERIYVPQWGSQPAYWLVRGFWVAGQPAVTRVIVITLVEGQDDPEYDLSSDDKASVSYTIHSQPLIGSAYTGVLKFSALPGTGEARGSFDCRMRGNAATDYQVIAEFLVR